MPQFASFMHWINTKSWQAAAYKKSLRNAIMLVVISLFTFFAINLAVQIVSTIISSINITIENGGQPVSVTELLANLPLGLISILGIVFGSLGFIILRATKQFKFKDFFINRRGFSIDKLLLLIGLIMLVQAILSFFQYLLGYFFFSGSGAESSSMLDNVMYNMLSLDGILYVVLVGPIFEELMFRGAILRTLERFGQNFAIVISSMLFGLYHLYLFQSIFAFFIGIILAYCTIRYNIVWAIILHILNNAFAMSSMLITEEAIMTGILFVFFGLGILALTLTFKSYKQQLCLGKATPIDVLVPLASTEQVGQPVQAAQPIPLAEQTGQTMQTVQAAQPIQYPPKVQYTLDSQYTHLLKAKPYGIAFSSAWLIVAVTIAGAVMIMMLF